MIIRDTAELLPAVFETDMNKSIRYRLAGAGIGAEII
jgi:hypothetical protein